MCPQIRKYYVILVHYGDCKSTNTVLTSLATCQSPPDDIIVIDNAKSPYLPPENIKHHLIRPCRNTGYAGGINIGIGVLTSRGAAENDIVVAMNNDVTISSNTLQKLKDWWQAHPADALLGTSISHVNLRTGRTHLRKPAARPHHRDYVDGAFLAAPYRIFLKTKGLPSHYFMYWEDVLFSTRVRHRGIPLQVAPGMQVQHQSFTNDKNDDKLYYLVRNGALFLEQETPLPWRLYWYVANRARLIYHTIRPHSSPIVRQALLDAARGITGPRKKH